MSLRSIIPQLNEIVRISPLCLYEREKDLSLCNACSELIYTGRVLIVCKDASEEKIVDTKKALVKAGFKVSIHEYQGAIDEVQDLSQLFTLEEDIRLVTTLDSSLILPTLYFATVSKIPAVINLLDCHFESAFACKMLVKTGDNLDKITLTNQRHIIIDESAFDGEDFLPYAFAQIQSKAFTLIDYRIKAQLQGLKIKLKGYSVIRECVLDTYSIFAHSKQKQKQKLIENLIKVYLADFLAEGEILFNNSVDTAVCLVNKGNSAKNKLIAQKLLLSLMEIYFSRQHENILESPDYLLRAKGLARLTSLPERAFSEQFIATANINERIDDAEIQKYYKEVTALKISADRMLNIYTALGGVGEDCKGEIAKAIKYAGDFPFGVNAVTLLRESGISEYL